MNNTVNFMGKITKVIPFSVTERQYSKNNSFCFVTVIEPIEYENKTIVIADMNNQYQYFSGDTVIGRFKFVDNTILYPVIDEKYDEN